LSSLAVAAFSLAISAGCNRIPPLSTKSATPRPSAMQKLSLDEPQKVALSFCQAWERGDWEAMHNLLTSKAQGAIFPSEFKQKYRSIHDLAQITALRTELIAINPATEGQVVASFKVRLDTTLVGQMETQNRLTLEKEGPTWRVAWTPAAIFENLEEGMLVHFAPKIPQRGNIYARDGSGLAMQGKLITVGVVPGWIKDEARLLDVLSATLMMSREEIRQKYITAARPDWFMPIADITPEQSAAYQSVFASLPGVARQEKVVRVYPGGALTSHIVGYTSKISAEELAKWRPLGYQPDDIVGKAGIEGWAERYLAGQRGGTLAIITASGQTVAVLKEQALQTSQSVYLTLDQRLQEVAYRALESRAGPKGAGAVVALDPTNGDILAMVSWPAVDANDLSRGLSPAQWQALLNRPDYPLLNRATQGQYPLGSVFKIASIAAALEKGGFNRSSMFSCAGSWMGLGDGLLRKCWLASGHGRIDLMEGLTQSCDVVFYEIGKALHRLDVNLLPEYGRGFGLGALTRVEGLDESAGLVPDAKWKETHPDKVSNPFWAPQDTVNLAIGQGYLLVTPLQAANLIAAVGNGGTLYRPRLVRQVMSLREGEAITFPTEEIGRLPVSPEHLALIRESLRRAVMAPQGTAYFAFEGVQVPMAGKTGTAETAKEEPHAWFVGYAPADNPRIAVAVVVEHGGEGSEVAAPIFREVVESYLGIAPAKGATPSPKPPSR